MSISIEKAIAVLQTQLNVSIAKRESPFTLAVKLGIEALQRELSCRAGIKLTSYDQLPSERMRL